MLICQVDQHSFRTIHAITYNRDRYNSHTITIVPNTTTPTSNMNTNSIRIIQSEKYIETYLVTIVYSVIPFNVHPLTKDTIVTDQLGTNSSSPGRFLSNRFLTKACYFLGSRVSFESSSVILPGLSPTFVEINTD